MAVTRSTAADRQRQAAIPSLTRGFPVQGRPGFGSRQREGALLAAGALVVLLGWTLVYLGAVTPLRDMDARLASGEIVNLNALQSSEKLLPVLAGAFESSAERAFATEQIWKRVNEGKLPNVGELGRIRVAAAEVRSDGRLETLRQRLEAREEGAESVPLLSLAQLRRIKPALVVRTPGQFRFQLILWGALFLAVFAVLHAVWRLRRFEGDQLILPAVLLLTGLGLAIMVSVRDPLRDLLLFRTFAQGVLGGAALMLAGSLVSYERSPLRRMTFLPLLGAFGLSILLILFGSGPGESDAKVNLFGFQPVEIIKLLVVLFLAGYLFDRWEFLRELPETRSSAGGVLRKLGIPKLEYLLPPLIAIGMVLVFFFLQKDMGPALILLFLFLILYCVARGRPWMAVLGMSAIAIAFTVAYKAGIPRTVSGRLSMWLSPWDNFFRGGDHLAQGLWALAGGALTGTGLGLGQPQRVPEVHTDFVLAAVGEELGFLGLLAVMALYVLLILRGFRAAFRSGGVYSFFLALGLTVVMAVEILLIAGGVVGVFPLSGVVSPFLSFGRTAMWMNFLVLGMILSVSADGGDPGVTRRFQGAARWAGLAFAAVLAVIVGKAAYIQVLRPDPILIQGTLTLQGDGTRRYQYNPRLVDIAREIQRGNIVDRNGVLLATSDPAELEKRRAILERLGATVDPPEGLRPRGERFYPFEGRMYHLLGDFNERTNWGAPNTSFVERDARVRLQGFDDFAGVVDVPQRDRDSTREIKLSYRELIPVLRHRHQPEHPEVTKITKGDRTLRLTIDARLQLRAAEIVEKYARQAGHGGAAVVLDAQTGDLLASVSYPWPRRLPVEAEAGDDEEGADPRLLDRARYGIYPPGSTFKMVTAMAALRKNPDAARDAFACQLLPDGRVGNRVRGWGRPIRDDLTDTVPHGQVNLEKGIVVSCNAYFAQLGTYDVGPAALLETAAIFGIDVAKPNTVEQLKDALPQAAYGQGQVVATPFQMARVAATLANKGAMPEGRWILGEGNQRSAEPKQALEPDLVRFLDAAMRKVVTQGTASRFLSGVVPGIAGKTGTAEVRGRASHSWFIGFAPYESKGGRRIAFGVIIEHGGYGGRLAAPAAGEIVRAAAELGIIVQPGAAGETP